MNRAQEEHNDAGTSTIGFQDPATDLINELNANNIQDLDRTNLAIFLDDENSLTRIIEALRTNTSVKYIDLSGHTITDQLAQQIAGLLAENKAILRLNLSHTNLSQNGIRVIAEALSYNCFLCDLYLNDNNIGDNGARHLAGALQKNNSIVRLELNNTGISDQGAKDILSGFQKNTSLSLLNLENCPISINAINHIVRIINALYPASNSPSNPCPQIIATLRFPNNPVTERITLRSGITNVRVDPRQIAYSGIVEATIKNTKEAVLKSFNDAEQKAASNNLVLLSEALHLYTKCVRWVNLLNSFAEPTIDLEQLMSKIRGTLYAIQAHDVANAMQIRSNIERHIFPDERDSLLQVVLKNVDISLNPPAAVPVKPVAIPAKPAAAVPSQQDENALMRTVIAQPQFKLNVTEVNRYLQRMINGTIQASSIIYSGLVDPAGHGIVHTIMLALHCAAPAVPLGAGILLEILAEAVDSGDKKQIAYKLRRVSQLVPTGDPRAIGEFSENLALKIIVDHLSQVLNLNPNPQAQSRFHIPAIIRKIFNVALDRPLNAYETLAKELLKPLLKQIMKRDQVPYYVQNIIPDDGNKFLNMLAAALRKQQSSNAPIAVTPFWNQPRDNTPLPPALGGPSQTVTPHN